MVDTALTPADRWRSLLAVVTCMTLVGITLGLTYPLLSLILEARGVSRTVIGLNAAMPAVAMVLMAPFFPRLIQRLRLKPFLAIMISTEALLFLALRQFDDVGAWFAIRFLMGVTTGGLFVAGETWINQIAEERTRGRFMAVYVISFNGGAALGPLVLIATGSDGWAPFLAGAACNLLGLLPLLLIGGVAPRLDGTPAFGVAGFVRVAPTLAAAIVAFAVIESAAGALLSVYGVRAGYGESASVAMLTTVLVGGILLQWPLGLLADRGDRYRLIGVLGILTLVGIAILPLLIEIPWAAFALLFVWGGVATGIYTVALVLVGQRFRGADLVTANAAMAALWGLASIGGPAAAGAAMDVWDPHGLVVVLAAVSATFVAIQFVRRTGRG